jgi:predicted RNase H-like HicB family nuclease
VPLAYDPWFVASCLENLKEAITLYYEDENETELLLPKNDQIYVTTLEMAL